MTFLSPSWRSLNLWKGHLNIPKRAQRLAVFLWKDTLAAFLLVNLRPFRKGMEFFCMDLEMICSSIHVVVNLIARQWGPSSQAIQFFLWKSAHLCLKYIIGKRNTFPPNGILKVIYQGIPCEQSPSTNPSHSGYYLYPYIDSIWFRGISCLIIMGCQESCYRARHHTVDERNPANQLRLVVQVFYIPGGAGFLNHQQYLTKLEF